MLILRNKHSLIFFILFVTKALFAQSGLSLRQLELTLQQSLQYIVKNQYTKTEEQHFKGEWYSSMGLTVPFPLLGYKKDFEDSNCFTISAIHNSLSEIYLSDTAKFHYLLPTIDSAYTAVLEFESNGTFNFWHYFPASKKIKCKARNEHLLVRKPSTFKLQTRFINNAANVMNDCDDTASGFTAAYYQAKIHQNSSKAPLLSPLIDKYIDKGRKNYHWYNLWNGVPINTGAYLTWIGEEHQHSEATFKKILLHTAFFWFPKSCAFPKAGVPYIPYGANDVDLVVNVNILAYLALNGELATNKNAKNVTQFTTRCLKKKNFQKAVIYYPNDFHLHYAMARAYEKGAKDLDYALKTLQKDLKLKQQMDGSFRAKRRINDGDAVQATAYALYAMLCADDIEQHKVQIEAAVQFLISEQKTAATGEIYWQSGVFFYGGTQG